METTTQGPSVRIAQIFLGRTLFEYTSNPLERAPNEPISEAGTNVQISIGMDDTQTRGVISVVVSSTPESASPYRFQLEMLGVMERLEGDTDLREYLATAGPPTLYPFIREAVANITGRGRFGPIWLAPINWAPITARLLNDLKNG